MTWFAAVWLSIVKSASLDPEHVAEALLAALKSARVAFVALFCGLTVDAAANGANSLGAFLIYYKAHWIAWAVTNVVAPAWRASAAYAKASTNRRSTDSSIP